MKRPHALVFCLLLLCAACGPTFLGQNDPEEGAPEGGRLDEILSAAADLALAGDEPADAGKTADLPVHIRAAAAAQASLNRMQEGGTNSWRGPAGLNSLTVRRSLTWRGAAVRVLSLRMQSGEEAKQWQGLAVQDKDGLWRFIERARRWSVEDTREFYRALDNPAEGAARSWSGGAGACSVTMRDTDIARDSAQRAFLLQVGSVRLEGKALKTEDAEWQIEDLR